MITEPSLKLENIFTVFFLWQEVYTSVVLPRTTTCSNMMQRTPNEYQLILAPLSRLQKKWDLFPINGYFLTIF